MSFKPGDKVVFDWDKRMNVKDDLEDYLIRRNINPYSVYTVKSLFNGRISLREFDEEFMLERFKKVPSWEVKFRKEVKHV